MTSGEGFTVEVKGNKMIIEVNLDAPKTPSTSGKSMVIASSRGNMSIPTPTGSVSLGLNVYTKR
jgi:hypothetical protein